MAQFKIDENLPVEVALLFKEAGYDAMTAAEQSLEGCVDPLIAQVCRDEQRAIVTLDLDFADIRTYPPASYFGIIVLRLHNQAKPFVLDVIRQLIPLLEREALLGKLWVVNEQTLRIRG